MILYLRLILHRASPAFLHSSFHVKPFVAVKLALGAHKLSCNADPTHLEPAIDLIKTACRFAFQLSDPCPFFVFHLDHCQDELSHTTIGQ